MKNFMFNGKLHGIYIQYYNSVNIMDKKYYKNGKREGEYIEYYENGNIKKSIILKITK